MELTDGWMDAIACLPVKGRRSQNLCVGRGLRETRVTWCCVKLGAATQLHCNFNAAAAALSSVLYHCNAMQFPLQMSDGQTDRVPRLAGWTDRSPWWRNKQEKYDDEEEEFRMNGCICNMKQQTVWRRQWQGTRDKGGYEKLAEEYYYYYYY